MNFDAPEVFNLLVVCKYWFSEKIQTLSRESTSMYQLGTPFKNIIKLLLYILKMSDSYNKPIKLRSKDFRRDFSSSSKIRPIPQKHAIYISKISDSSNNFTGKKVLDYNSIPFSIERNENYILYIVFREKGTFKAAIDKILDSKDPINVDLNGDGKLFMVDKYNIKSILSPLFNYGFNNQNSFTNTLFMRDLFMDQTFKTSHIISIFKESMVYFLLDSLGIDVDKDLIKRNMEIHLNINCSRNHGTLNKSPLILMRSSDLIRMSSKSSKRRDGLDMEGREEGKKEEESNTDIVEDVVFNQLKRKLDDSLDNLYQYCESKKKKKTLDSQDSILLYSKISTNVNKNRPKSVVDNIPLIHQLISENDSKSRDSIPLNNNLSYAEEIFSILMKSIRISVKQSIEIKGLIDGYIFFKEVSFIGHKRPIDLFFVLEEMGLDAIKELTIYVNKSEIFDEMETSFSNYVILGYLNQNYHEWLDTNLKRDHSFSIHMENLDWCPFKNTVISKTLVNMIKNIVVPKCFEITSIKTNKVEVHKKSTINYVHQNKKSKRTNLVQKNTILNYIEKNKKKNNDKSIEVPQSNLLYSEKIIKNYKDDISIKIHKESKNSTGKSYNTILSDLILLVNINEVLMDLCVIPKTLSIIPNELLMNYISKFMDNMDNTNPILNVKKESNIPFIIKTCQRLFLLNQILKRVQKLKEPIQLTDFSIFEKEEMEKEKEEMEMEMNRQDCFKIVSYAFKLHFPSLLPPSLLFICKKIPSTTFNFWDKIHHYYKTIFGYNGKNILRCLNYQSHLLPLLYLNGDGSVSNWRFRELRLNSKVMIDLNYITWTGRSTKDFLHLLNGNSNTKTSSNENESLLNENIYIKPKKVLNLVYKEDIRLKMEIILLNSDLVKKEMALEVIDSENMELELENFLKNRMNLYFKDINSEENQKELCYSTFLQQNNTLPILLIEKDKKTVKISILLEVFRLNFKEILKNSLKII